jgi:hypothetical protein
MNSAGLGYDSTADFSEHANEFLGSIKTGNLLS